MLESSHLCYGINGGQGSSFNPQRSKWMTSALLTVWIACIVGPFSAPLSLQQRRLLISPTIACQWTRPVRRRGDTLGAEPNQGSARNCAAGKYRERGWKIRSKIFVSFIVHCTSSSRSNGISVKMTEAVLFDAQFQIKAIDPDGKKFDRGE